MTASNLHFAGNAKPRVYPAYAYLGPFLLVPLVSELVYAGARPFMSRLIVSLTLEPDWSGLIDNAFLLLSLGLSLIATTISVALAYASYRWLMPWFYFLMSPVGRTTRADYWLKYWLPFTGYLVVLYLTVIIGQAMPVLFLDGPKGNLLDNIVRNLTYHQVSMTTAMLWPMLAVLSKRIHDRGKPAWFLLIWLIPIIGPLWLFIEVGLLPGTAGPNPFGPDPIEIRDHQRRARMRHVS